MTGTARNPRRLTDLRSAVAVGVLAALTVMTAGCTATSSGSAPAESGPGAGSGSTMSAVAAGRTPLATGTAAIPDIELAVGRMLDGGNRYDNLIKAFVVQVDGKPVVERYHPDWGPGASKNVFSVTKSVMSLLIGIAIDEGSIAGVDQTLAELLPQYVSVMAPGVAEVTLEQVLTMTGGILPDDDPSWLDPGRQPDWLAAILSTPLQQPPGTSFAYSSLGSHLLSGILATATGRSSLEFAQEKVFGPLSIVSQPTAEPTADPHYLQEYDTTSGFAWRTDPQGLQFGASDLKITAPDMIKIGQLYLDRGQWQGTQIVSTDWVARSTTAHVETDFSPAPGYGYQWWTMTAGDHPAFAAVGYAGQLIEVVPELGLVVAVACQDDPASFQADSFIQLIEQNLVPLVES